VSKVLTCDMASIIRWTVKPGDRVAYIVTAPKKADIDTDMLQIARAEDPVWAKDQLTMKADCHFYFNHGIRSPLETVLGMFMESPFKSLGWQQEEAESLNKARGQMSLATSFGFVGNTVGVAKTSKIARIPKRKAPPPPVVAAKKVAGGIGNIFTKKN